MGRVVIVAYRPRPGRASELRALCAEHVPTLRAEGLVTSRLAIVAEAADGTIVEVFEWISGETIERAHSNAAVQRLWERYAEVCDFVPIATVPEASRLFAEFTPLGQP